MPTGADRFPPGRWRARWIWAPPAASGSSPSGRTVVALRREVAVAAVPAAAPARICAVSRYVLFVNGEEAARGPVRANPRRQPYDVVDLAPYLQSGPNAIAALAWCYDTPMPWWLPPPAMANDLGQGAFVFEAHVGDDMLVSDSFWQATVLDGFGSTRPQVLSGRGRELIDLRHLPDGWSRAGADVRAWPAAELRRAFTVGEPGRPEPPSYPGGPLEARSLSWPALTVVALDRDEGGGAFATDRVVAGVVAVELEGPPGAEAVFQAAEFVDVAGRPAAGEHDASFAVRCDGSRRLAVTNDAYGLRALAVQADDGVVVHRVEVHERLHPVRGDAWFRCSDPRLEQIWSVGRRTVSLCSWDAYVDCPTREQRAWVGDSVVHQMVDLTTNTDWSLARWNTRLAGSPRPDGMLPMAVAGDIEKHDFTVIPDWALHWVHAVWNLYRYSGDRDEIAELLPVVERVVRWFVPFCRDGVPVDVFGWVIIDWSSVYTEGVSATLCGLWGRALVELAEMADWLDDRGRAGWARRTHSGLAAGFERMWDGPRSRYADSLTDGELRPMASQHGQAAAIVGRLAPAELWPRLVEVLTDEAALVDAAFSVPDGPATPNSGKPVGGALHRTGLPEPWWDVDRQVVRAQPFFRYVVHDALVAAGCSDLIAAQCLDWTTALERCDTSWSETWYGGTVTHGWSSTPTRDLMMYVLGVQPAEPGFGRARIEPALGGLEWAGGGVPCPAGLITVEARAGGGLTVDSPIPFVSAGREWPAGRHEVVAGGGASTVK